MPDKTTAPTDAKLNFRTVGEASQTLNRLSPQDNDLGRLLDTAYAASPNDAMTLSQAVIAREIADSKAPNQIRSLVEWGGRQTSDKRRTVIQGFLLSRANITLVHGISGLPRAQARPYMADYFAVGGDMGPVAEWLSEAGAYLRSHARPGTDGWFDDAIDAISDTASSAWDAVTEGVNSVVDAVLKAGKSMADAFKAALDWTVDKVCDLVNSLVSAGKKIADILAAAAANSVDFLGKVVKALVKLGKSLAEMVVWAGAQALRIAKAVVGTLIQLGKTVAQLIGTVLTAAAKVLRTVAQAIYDITRNILDLLVAVAGKALSVIQTVLQALLAMGVHLVDVIADICEDVAAGFRRGFFEGLIAIGKAPLTILQEAAKAGAALVGLAFAVLLEIFGSYRGLNDAEMAEARKIFGWSIDLARVKLAVASIPVDVIEYLNGNRAFTTMYLINFASWDRLTMDTLIHELTHVWQGVVDGPVYMVEALHSQLFGRGYQVTDADLARADGDITKLEREQQATVVEYYWRGRYGGETSIDWSKYESLAQDVYRPRSAVVWPQFALPAFAFGLTDVRGTTS